MKHIKRKYLLRVANSAMGMLQAAGQIKNADSANPAKDVQEFLDDGQEKIAIIATDKDELVMGFVHSVGKELYAIPEPDPVLVYFNNAQRMFASVEKFKGELFKKLEPLGKTNLFSGDVGDKLYDFMYASTSCAIFLFTSVEAMINKTIPTEFVYEKKSESGKIKKLDFEAIQRYLDFKTKLEVLSQATHKSFSESHPEQYNQILTLKDLRDSIIHTNRKSKNIIGSFSHIFKDSLAFDYQKTIYAARDFINFYQPDWIEECKCGKDF